MALGAREAVPALAPGPRAREALDDTLAHQLGRAHRSRPADRVRDPRRRADRRDAECQCAKGGRCALLVPLLCSGAVKKEGRGHARTRRSSYSPLSGLKPQKGHSQSVAGSGLGIRLRLEGIGEKGCLEAGGVSLVRAWEGKAGKKKRNLIRLFLRLVSESLPRVPCFSFCKGP